MIQTVQILESSLERRNKEYNKEYGRSEIAQPRPRTQSSFVLFSDFTRQIIQDGVSTNELDGVTISAQI